MTGPEMMVQKILHMMGVNPKSIEDAIATSTAAIQIIARHSEEIAILAKRTYELVERNNVILEQLAIIQGLSCRRDETFGERQFLGRPGAASSDVGTYHPGLNGSNNTAGE